MALGYDGELVDRLARLCDELGPLGSVCVIGFSAEKAEVERALELVAKDARWRYADLRAADGDTSLAKIRELLAAPFVVLALRPGNLRRATSTFIGAGVDRKPSVDLGDRTARLRGKGQSLYLLVEGLPVFAEAPLELQRVPYWDVIP